MTPKQIVLLLDRNRLERQHFEHVTAYNPWAVINYSPYRPEDGVKLTDFMPSYRDKRGGQSDEMHRLAAMTDEELEAASRMSVLIAEEAQRQRGAQYGQ